jgi:hypothetical protein
MFKNAKKSSRFTAGNEDELSQKFEILQGLCFCLVFDLCFYLAGKTAPVPADIPEYKLKRLREIPRPWERMSHYVAPELLESWKTALEPFFAANLRLAPELGDGGDLSEDGLIEGKPVRATVKFQNRSAIYDQNGVRGVLPRAEWQMSVFVNADLTRIDHAVIRPAAAR